METRPIVTTVTRREMRAMLKQAQREQEAQDAGFECHAAYVLAHRAERRATLQARKSA
jgi:hypothetical protein